jgi:hypothetical protein
VCEVLFPHLPGNLPLKTCLLTAPCAGKLNSNDFTHKNFAFRSKNEQIIDAIAFQLIWWHFLCGSPMVPLPHKKKKTN